jgi:hypothetical protein
MSGSASRFRRFDREHNHLIHVHRLSLPLRPIEAHFLSLPITPGTAPSVVFASDLSNSFETIPGVANATRISSTLAVPHFVPPGDCARGRKSGLPWLNHSYIDHRRFERALRRPLRAPAPPVHRSESHQRVTARSVSSVGWSSEMDIPAFRCLSEQT